MAILKLDATDRALLSKALHLQNIKKDTPNGADLYRLAENRTLGGTDQQLREMQSGLVKFGHVSRRFRQHDNARLATMLSARIEAYKQERKQNQLKGDYSQ